MARGGNNGARVLVVEGEVHVEEEAEKLKLVEDEVHAIAPPLDETGRVTPVTDDDADGKAVPDVDQLAAAFIKRRKEAFGQQR
ncbi:hypothetical protein BAE44_0007330 [Dichanthelium oligosanthes]|uniref:Uncharacterized protein n=1 Tax=Dichanthelium oligosanthes TaxID=888268 RepID=A0A1E5W2N3_9POAL|nr:hypothetical protein BAE44_0007330 [Dichanthelium oligosanthes]